MKRSAFLLIGLLVASLFSACAAADNFLDAYLNNIRLGQTFATGPKVVEIYQIAVQSRPWSSAWGEGTSLVMTLYDGPDKGSKLQYSSLNAAFVVSGMQDKQTEGP